MKLEKLKKLLCEILINILADKKNGFEKKEYYIVSRLLWAINNYPKIMIPYTKFGLCVDYGNYLEKYVIKFEETFLWIGIEGFERSFYGLDSYEKEIVYLVHSEKVQNIKFEFEEIHPFFQWYNDTTYLISNKDTKFIISCSDPEIGL